MKKKIYEKPTCKVIKIQQHQILCGSPVDPLQPDGVPWWDGEGGTRRFNGFDDWNDEDD